MEMKVTYILTCFNHAKYIKEALISAFEQSYKNIEFIISDDSSTDDSFDIIEEVSAGYSHLNIKLNRNNVNMGIGLHMNSVINRASGELIIMAAGDDISELNRVKVLVSQWLHYEKPSILASSLTEIDENGCFISTDLTKRFSNENNIVLVNKSKEYIQGSLLACAGATMAYSRSVVDFFGDFDSNVNSEDVIYFYRGLLLGSVVLISDPLVKYRRTSTSFSAPIRYKMNIFSSPKLNYSPDFNLLKLLQHKKDFMKLNLLDKNELYIIDRLIEKEMTMLTLSTSNFIERVKIIKNCKCLNLFSYKFILKNILPLHFQKLIFNIKYNIKHR